MIRTKYRQFVRQVRIQLCRSLRCTYSTYRYKSEVHVLTLYTFAKLHIYMMWSNCFINTSDAYVYHAFCSVAFLSQTSYSLVNSTVYSWVFFWRYHKNWQTCTYLQQCAFAIRPSQDSETHAKTIQQFDELATLHDTTSTTIKKIIRDVDDSGAVWLRQYLAVWLRQCLSRRLRQCLARRLCQCLAWRLCQCLAWRLCQCLVWRLRQCPTSWCSVAR